MRKLNNLTAETIHLAVLEENDVDVEKLERLHPIKMYSRIGRVTPPPHCTGVGKAIAAFLPADRVNGLSDRSHSPGTQNKPLPTALPSSQSWRRSDRRATPSIEKSTRTVFNASQHPSATPTRRCGSRSA